MNMITLCKSYVENKKMIELLENNNKEIKSNIIRLMNNQDQVNIAGYTIKNVLVNSKRFNSKALKIAKPDLYKKYLQNTSYNRFTIN